MLTLPSTVRIYMAAEPVDPRRGFDGLAAATRQIIREDPLSGHLFCFVNRRANRLKVLLWQPSGYLLLFKRRAWQLQAASRPTTGSAPPGTRLARVTTSLLQGPPDENNRPAIATAEIEPTVGTFDALGDAESVNNCIVPHSIRMAERRGEGPSARSRKADHLIVEAIRADGWPASSLPRILWSWGNPDSPDLLGGLTAWRRVNALTQVSRPSWTISTDLPSPFSIVTIRAFLLDRGR